MASNSNLSSMRRLVEQLKLEASVERIKVSQAAAELQQYCLQNAGKMLSQERRLTQFPVLLSWDYTKRMSKLLAAILLHPGFLKFELR
ncbi:hypothetical protein WMY93_021830 [Mugilogobius chulae]|uniref:Guanine nucleotide-binding protein subunit gamma n=1 Tax=Mugilogobius chulae TaxID=88201 RepID=A0AAW0NDA4_9GOBI